MRISGAAMGVVMVLLLSLCGCQSEAKSPENDAPTAQSESTVSNADCPDYNLSQEFSYQGVTIMGDQDWEINDPKAYDYNLQIDKPDNSHITIRSALYGQTATLDDAWAEYTNAEDNPVTEESWDADGVTYNSGYYGDNHLLLSGCETSSGKGFLLWMTFDTDNWTHDQAKELFDKLIDTLSYDPNQTNLDYKEAFRAGQSTDNSISTSENSTDSSAETATPKQYGEGMYKVGTDIPAGEYRLTATSDSGYWEVTASSAADADIIGNDNFGGSTYVTVSEGQYLKLNRCYAEPVQ